MTVEADALVGRYFPVLDHGFVALTGYLGDDATIEQYARVSYGKGTRKISDTAKLIRTLVRDRHSTPVESVEVSLHLALPIHVARQLVRHRTWSPINEYSARYSVVPEIFYTISKEQFKAQSKINRQGRGDQLDDELYEEFTRETVKNQNEAFRLYKKALYNGVAREIARMHLPLNTYTYWYAKMDLGNIFKLLKLRIDPHAQWEIQQVVKPIAGMIQTIVPSATQAYIDYIHCTRTLTRLDLELLNSDGSPTSVMTDLVCKHEMSMQSLQERAKGIGMSDREFTEFCGKFDRIEQPDFSLNLADSLSAEEIQAKMAAAEVSA